MGQFFLRLFSFEFSKDILYFGRNYIVIIIVGCILSTPVLKTFYEKHKNGFVGNILHLLILLLSIAYLADATYNPFLYFRF